MRVIKLAAFTALVAAVLGSVSYGAFFFSEYVSGAKYVDYLQQNKESKSLNEPFDYELMKDDIQNNDLILVGEIHGFSSPTDFDVEFYTHLRTQFAFDTYLAEMDYSQAYFMNTYNRTGDDALLERVLSHWAVNIGRENSDYKKRWKRLRALYQSGATFTYYGNDKIRDVSLLYKHLADIDQQLALHFDEGKTESEQLKDALAAINGLMEQKDISESVQWELNHLKANIQFRLNDVHREAILTDNLIALYDHYDLFNKKVYGFYGLGHTLTHPIAEGLNPMASRIGEKNAWFKEKTLSINMLFVDSYMTVHSNSLPSFMQSEGKYSKLPVSYDSLLTYYAYGIMDLKMVTESSTKTLFKMDNEGSPYRESQRLFHPVKLLPFGTTLTAAENASTADYGQYLLLFRNSDWAKPTGI
ncbi:hypothetical protein [Alteromonas sp. CYL-A6]|uniref:hypothetical protein n=1 Tax=Alteromonas nitratireducens TaxID=3390813 RepID=UPI0034AE125A